MPRDLDPSAPRAPTPGPELSPAALAAPRLGLFGGSFDPVHAGHLTVVRAALGAGRVDHLALVPARISPHKLDRPPVEGRLRAELLGLALGTLEPELRSRTSIWTIELDLEGPSFTARTVDLLGERRGPGAGLPVLVIGQDSLAGLPRWARVEELLAAVELAVVERRGDPPIDGTLERLAGSLSPAALERVRAGWLPLDEPSAASSTEARAALARGDVDRELPAPVLARARELGVYRDLLDADDRPRP